jgi:hypothetical protein
MVTKERFTAATGANPVGKPGLDGPDLVERYSAHPAETDATDAQKQELLLALYRIMQGFVDLGFSIRPGEKFSADSPLCMDDVLEYPIPLETAPETSAPPTPDKSNTEA